MWRILCCSVCKRTVFSQNTVEGGVIFAQMIPHWGKLPPLLRTSAGFDRAAERPRHECAVRGCFCPRRGIVENDCKSALLRSESRPPFLFLLGAREKETRRESGVKKKRTLVQTGIDPCFYRSVSARSNFSAGLVQGGHCSVSPTAAAPSVQKKSAVQLALAFLSCAPGCGRNFVCFPPRGGKCGEFCVAAFVKGLFFRKIPSKEAQFLHK